MTAPQAVLSSVQIPAAAVARLERVRGIARVAVHAEDGRTRLRQNYQSGSARVRFPRAVAGEPLEAVLLNTAGGVTGGDRLSYSVSVGDGAHGIATTQTAERVYRRLSDVAAIETHLRVDGAASLDWLPQETILFDRSALTRTLAADVAPTGRLLAIETIVLGRTAMEERATDIALVDSWRVRRGGTLVFADTLRLDGDAVAIMSTGATGNGAAAIATLVLVAPEAEAALDKARAALATAGGEGGASAWNGILVARLIAATAQTLRADLVRLIEALRGKPMPRVWNC